MISTERPLLGGTDGYRGEATFEEGPGKMNPETIAGLSFALVRHQQEAGVSGPVVIARDTRPSGDYLSKAAVQGARFAGAEVIDGGILPTPTAQKHAESIDAMAAIVITASHNPAKDNGWKGMLGSRKPSKDEVQSISGRFWEQYENGLHIPADGGMAAGHPNSPEIIKAYGDMIVIDIERQFGEQPLSGKLFVIDSANGAAGGITPEIFRRLGAEVQAIAVGEGLINDGYGAADLSGLKQFLRSRPDITKHPGFVGGLATDGDADRVMGAGISSQGKVVEINGNHIMEALAANPNQPGIVGTLYTNSGLRQRLAEKGIAFEECGNGDVHVTNTLRAKQLTDPGWQRGGEFTGHMIDTTWLGSGDGIRTAAWFAALASVSGRTFGEIYDQQPMWPEAMSKLEIPKGISLEINESALLLKSLDLVRQLGVRPVVRTSGTEPVVRVWTEAPDEFLADSANELLCNSVRELTEEIR